jgi:hypothetical protein
VGENAVEGDAPVFVGIESLIEEVAEEASVLRNAFAVDALGRSDGFGRVFGIGGEIANGSEASAGYNGISNDVNVFVNPAGLEATIEANIAVALGELAIYDVRELPLGARDYGARRIA